MVVLGLLASVRLVVAAAPAALPIEQFTRRAEIENVEPSPSGRRLALLTHAANGFMQLGVMDLDPLGPLRFVAGFSDADVTKVRWVNDDRLIFEAFQSGAEVSEGGAGTFAVNHDGTFQRQLIAWRRRTESPTGTNIASRLLPYGWYLHSTIDDGSNDVLVVRQVKDAVGDLDSVELSRIDTTTLAMRSLSVGKPPGSRQWLTDASGEPRMVSAYRKGRNIVYWRAGQQWQQVADFDPLSEPGFTPWFIDDKGQIAVTTRALRDTRSVHLFDPIDKRLDPEPMVAVTGFDLDPIAESDSQTGKLVGMHFRADRRMSVWFDESIQAIQKGLDAALPSGRSNLLLCGRCTSTRFFVVYSSSDRQPGEYYLFDRKEAALRRIGSNRPWIDEQTQGKRTFHRVATRDGMSMPVYITHPAGAAPNQPLPAVVVVHGGPWVRGTDLGWEAEAQFLASRGYRVIEPEFRGSEGYGSRHFKAGWKQWGLAIQDDLVDAVQWAAKDRLVDPSRVCIMGASFGGYAALMGPIAHPGVYQCAVSFAGVTDIGLMYSISWSDLSLASRQYSMPTLIGDPDTEAARLAMQSPLQRASEIKIPVLLAHGGRDRRVPIDHAARFVSAARAGGAEVEYVAYASEGHGWFDPANQANFFSRLEVFLARALKAAR